MKTETYQGWTNAQTWCIAGLLNNTSKLQNEALKAVRDNLEFPNIARVELLEIAKRNVCEVYDFADWCWSDGQSLTADVDWHEIAEHFEMKVKEERLET